MQRETTSTSLCASSPAEHPAELVSARYTIRRTGFVERTGDPRRSLGR
jgi:hypothetical protein